MQCLARHPWRLVAGAFMAGVALAPVHATEDEPAREGGSIDGIYQCRAQVEGTFQDAYLTLNGKRDGKSIYLIAAHTPERQSIGGYGIGRVSGSKFVGATSDGKKFDFTVALGSSDSDTAYETVSLKGKAGVKTLGGVLVNAVLDCNRIW